MNVTAHAVSAATCTRNPALQAGYLRGTDSTSGTVIDDCLCGIASECLLLFGRGSQILDVTRDTQSELIN